MLTSLLARLGIEAAAPAVRTFARPIAYLAAALAILLSVWLVIRWDGRRLAKLERDTIISRDAHWRAEIEAKSREVAQRQAERATAAAVQSAKLVAERDAAEARITELERTNAALPNANRIGLSRARARLLLDR